MARSRPDGSFSPDMECNFWMLCTYMSLETYAMAVSGFCVFPGTAVCMLCIYNIYSSTVQLYSRGEFWMPQLFVDCAPKACEVITGFRWSTGLDALQYLVPGTVL
jgi:hypothetical protein